MGAWGYGPFDNDDAGDMIAKLMRKVTPVIRTAKITPTTSSYYPGQSGEGAKGSTMNAFWVEATDGKDTYRILVIAGRVAVCTYYAGPTFIGERWPDFSTRARDLGHTWKILE